MGQPTIGEAEIVPEKEEKIERVKELTILDKNSKESIFNLIFPNTEGWRNNK